MKELGRKIARLLEVKGWTISDLSSATNIPYETLKNIIYDRSDDIKSFRTLKPLAIALNVTSDFLIGITNYPEKELNILRKYRQSSNHGQKFIEAMADFESNYTKFENKQICTKEVECFIPQPEKENLDENAIVIPCLELTGSFKDGILYDTSIKRIVKTHLQNAFMSLLIPNDTLANTYYKDDIVFLERRRPSDGEIAMFHKDNYMYIRQYKKEGNKHILRSLNINTDDIVLNSSEFSQYSVVGTCIYIYRRND